MTPPSDDQREFNRIRRARRIATFELILLSLGTVSAIVTTVFAWTAIFVVATIASLLVAGVVMCIGLLWGKGAGLLAATISFPILWIAFAAVVFLILAVAETAASVGIS